MRRTWVPVRLPHFSAVHPWKSHIPTLRLVVLSVTWGKDSTFHMGFIKHLVGHLTPTRYRMKEAALRQSSLTPRGHAPSALEPGSFL